MTDKLLTITEVAAWLQVTERTVRRMMTRDQIPYIKAGGSVRFDLPAVLERLRIPAAPADEQPEA